MMIARAASVMYTSERPKPLVKVADIEICDKQRKKLNWDGYVEVQAELKRVGLYYDPLCLTDSFPSKRF